MPEHRLLLDERRQAGPKEGGERPRRLHRASEARIAKAPSLPGSAFLVGGDQDLEPIPAPSERRVEARRAETPRPTGAVRIEASVAGADDELTVKYAPTPSATTAAASSTLTHR